MLSLADIGTAGLLVPGGAKCWFREGFSPVGTGWEPSIQSPTTDGVTGTSTLLGRRWTDGGIVSIDKFAGVLISGGRAGGVRGGDENIVSTKEDKERGRPFRSGEGGGEYSAATYGGLATTGELVGYSAFSGGGGDSGLVSGILTPN